MCQWPKTNVDEVGDLGISTMAKDITFLPYQAHGRLPNVQIRMHVHTYLSICII